MGLSEGRSLGRDSTYIVEGTGLGRRGVQRMSEVRSGERESFLWR
jgi:hypothetical protein